jgi:nucleoside-diphosphate-sugar epimerase
MRVIVTGASGFIGHHCLSLLLEKGYEVHAVSSRPYASTSDVHWHQLNLLDAAQTKSFLRNVKPSHLLHLAWYTEHGLYWNSLENLNWLNASFQLLYGFTELGGQRFVSAGTCAEYEWSSEHFSEASTPCRPNTVYGAAKYNMHLLLETWSRQTGLSSASGRVFFLYGPGENSSRLVPSVINSLLRGEPALCTHGEQVRDFMYVTDVAAAFVSLLDSQVQGAVNISSGQGVRVKDVVRTIADQLSRMDLVRFGAISTPFNEPSQLIADVARLRDEVGFRPAYQLDKGISLTIESVKTLLAS